MLNEFRNYMEKRSLKNYDVALLITRYLFNKDLIVQNLILNIFPRQSICQDNTNRCSTVGKTFTGSMCTQNSYVIIKDIGLSSGYHIAHELGHL